MWEKRFCERPCQKQWSSEPFRFLWDSGWSNQDFWEKCLNHLGLGGGFWSKHTPWVYVLYGQGKSRNQGYPNAPTIGGWYPEDAGLRPPRLAGKIWEDLSIWEIRPVILLVVNRTAPASTPQQSQLEVQKWSSLHFPRVSLLFYKQRLAALQVEVSDLNVNLELGPITFSGWVNKGSWSMTSPRKWRLKRMWLSLFNG